MGATEISYVCMLTMTKVATFFSACTHMSPDNETPKPHTLFLKETHTYTNTYTHRASSHQTFSKPPPQNIIQIWPFNWGLKISVITAITECFNVASKHRSRNRLYNYYTEVQWCQKQVSIHSWWELVACVTPHNADLGVEQVLLLKNWYDHQFIHSQAKYTYKYQERTAFCF